MVVDNLASCAECTSTPMVKFLHNANESASIRARETG